MILAIAELCYTEIALTTCFFHLEKQHTNTEIVKKNVIAIFKQCLQFSRFVFDNGD